MQCPVSNKIVLSHDIRRETLPFACSIRSPENFFDTEILIFLLSVGGIICTIVCLADTLLTTHKYPEVFPNFNLGSARTYANKASCINTGCFVYSIEAVNGTDS